MYHLTLSKKALGHIPKCHIYQNVLRIPLTSPYCYLTLSFTLSLSIYPYPYCRKKEFNGHNVVFSRVIQYQRSCLVIGLQYDFHSFLRALRHPCFLLQVETSRRFTVKRVFSWNRRLTIFSQEKKLKREMWK